MRRRLASQVFGTESVCFQCALRPRVKVFGRPEISRGASALFSSCGTSAQGSATQRKEDDEEEFSMLARNASRPFPSRHKPQQPLSDSRGQNSEPSFRIRRFVTGEQSLRDNGSARAQDWSHITTSNDKGTEPSQPRSSKNVAGLGQSFNRSGKWSVNLSQNQDRDPASQVSARRQQMAHVNQRTGEAQSGFKISRSAPSERDRTPLDSSHVQREPRQFRPFAANGRNEESSRYSRTSNEGISEQTQQEGYGRGLRGRQNDSKYTQAEASQGRDSPVDGESAGVVQTVLAPASTGYDDAGEHRRRRDKFDKKPQRNDRFEAESSDIVMETAEQRARRRAFDAEIAEAEAILYGQQKKKKKGHKHQKQTAIESRPSISLPEFVSVERLAKMLKVDLEKFIAQLEEEGFEGARYDHILDSGTSSMFADLYGFEPILVDSISAGDLLPRPSPEDPSSLPSRPPIVTIMGHVDHGKTTILDYLRKSSVVASEHGGITQHIGAFSVRMPGTERQITFLDTPGHAAFLEMRRRGANVTDIVVLVVAADDSVKPQTIEAIKHAKDAGVQLIVAINKVDKQDADVEKVKQDLTRYDIVVEDYGGDYQAIALSGKTGQGMDQLEEAIVTLADVHDYRAETDGPAEGWIIESKVTIAGRVATVLVRRGTLRPGDFIVAGSTWARVRTLRNDSGEIVTEAPPGTPVQVDGWRGEDPSAGLEVLQADDENHAKDVVKLRLERRETAKITGDIAAMNSTRTEEAEARAKVLAWEAEQDWSKKGYGLRPKDNEGWVEQEDHSGPKKVHFVIKADVAGSVEALVAAVSAIGSNEVAANIIHSGTGLVSESDIKMLAATGETGYAISFNQPVEGTTARLAQAASLEILNHNIIYKVVDVVRDRLADHLPPKVTQRVLGEAEIGQVFEIVMKKGKTKIAGCRVTNGTISRAHKVRVQRDAKVIYTGTLHSLKNVKKDVTEMRKGTECGMGFEEWQDFQTGDQIQCFEELEEKRMFY